MALVVVVEDFTQGPVEEIRKLNLMTAAIRELQVAVRDLYALIGVAGNAGSAVRAISENEDGSFAVGTGNLPDYSPDAT